MCWCVEIYSIHSVTSRSGWGLQPGTLRRLVGRCLIANWEKLGKSSFSQKLFFSEFRLKLGRPGGVRGERTEHTKIFRRTLAGFGLTWGQKVHFSTFHGKLSFQCTRNGPQNPPFCPGPLQDTFIIYSSISHQHIFRTYFAKRNISRMDNLKI